jgi:hypothetical protein
VLVFAADQESAVRPGGQIVQGSHGAPRIILTVAFLAIFLTPIVSGI